jgi:hypothetical protein
MIDGYVLVAVERLIMMVQVFRTAMIVAVMAGSASAADAPPTDRATKDDYAIDVTKTTTAMKIGADGSFSIVITPKNGKKIHGDAPLEVKLSKSAQVKPEKEKLGRADVVDKTTKDVELKTVLHPLQKGAASIGVDFSFFLCVDAWCQRMSDRVDVPVTIE